MRSLLWWACGSNNTLLRTTDGGGIWQQSAAPSTVGVDWKGISMLDDTTGWAVGTQYSVAYTRDGGLTWRRVIHGPPDADPGVTYWDVWVRACQNPGWAGGVGLHPAQGAWSSAH